MQTNLQKKKMAQFFFSAWNNYFDTAFKITY